MEIIFSTRGKCSSFGGPLDKGVSTSEGLALFEVSDLANKRYRHLFREFMQAGHGLARSLNPSAHYCAMRWDYAKTPKSLLRNCIVRVQWQDASPIWCHPADWGPNVSTGRVIDLSPGAMAALGCSTDTVLEVALCR